MVPFLSASLARVQFAGLVGVPTNPGEELHLTIWARPTDCCTLIYISTSAFDHSIPVGHPCQSLSLPWEAVVTERVSIHLELHKASGMFTARWLRLYYNGPSPTHWLGCKPVEVLAIEGRKKLACLIELFLH